MKPKDANCAICLRPVRLHWEGQAPMCPECANAQDAMLQAQGVEDARERAAIEDYARSLRRVAWGLGGCFDGMESLPIHPLRVDAAGSDVPHQLAGRNGRTTVRPRGRPRLHPSDRLVRVGMRVPPAVNDKLKRLGRAWLVAQVMAATQVWPEPLV